MTEEKVYSEVPDDLETEDPGLAGGEAPPRPSNGTGFRVRVFESTGHQTFLDKFRDRFNTDGITVAGEVNSDDSARTPSMESVESVLPPPPPPVPPVPPVETVETPVEVTQAETPVPMTTEPDSDPWTSGAVTTDLKPPFPVRDTNSYEPELPGRASTTGAPTGTAHEYDRRHSRSSMDSDISFLPGERFARTSETRDPSKSYLSELWSSRYGKRRPEDTVSNGASSVSSRRRSFSFESGDAAKESQVGRKASRTSGESWRGGLSKTARSSRLSRFFSRSSGPGQSSRPSRSSLVSGVPETETYGDPTEVTDIPAVGTAATTAATATTTAPMDTSPAPTSSHGGILKTRTDNAETEDETVTVVAPPKPKKRVGFQ